LISKAPGLSGEGKTRKSKSLFKRWLSVLNYPFISAYKGYGNSEEIVVLGHVFKSMGIASGDQEKEKHNNLYQNARAMLKRYAVTPLSGARVEVHIGNERHVAISDEDGFIRTAIKNPNLQPGWHKYTFKYHPGLDGVEETIQVTEDLLILGDDGTSIISDIDDTFLVSHSTKPMKKVWLLMSKNAERRRFFDDVIDHYHLLNINQEDQENGIFFVSSSEWNLYDFLQEVCEQKGMPKGVMLLKSIKKGLRQAMKSGGGNHSHKLIKIRRIMEFYPGRKFVLLGDNGQKDPYIYEQVANFYPGRIRAIYLRNVVEKNTKKVRKIAKKLARSHQIPLYQFTAEDDLQAISTQLLSDS
jgi:phosphatidate phosphatase APP1